VTAPSKWALVTGASSGIGRELARLLAAEGWGLVLTARRELLLRELEAELGQTNGTTIRCFATDLAKPGSVAPLVSFVEREGIDIELLVNNAGVGAFGRTDGIPSDDQAELVDLNCRALVELTTRLLPGMISRKSGGVLNVGSVAGFLPGPYMASYFASKAFVLSFSLALAEELEGTGVTVTCLSPGPTPTEFGSRKTLRGRKGSSPFPVPVERVAREGLEGWKKGRRIVVPGRRMRLIALVASILPRRWSARLIARAQRQRL
jgi:short-subunit dehydrogenase